MPVYDEQTFETNVPGIYVAGHFTSHRHIKGAIDAAKALVPKMAEKRRQMRRKVRRRLRAAESSASEDAGKCIDYLAQMSHEFTVSIASKSRESGARPALIRPASDINATKKAVRIWTALLAIEPF